MEVEVRNNGLEIQKKIYTIGVNEELIAILEEMASENN